MPDEFVFTPQRHEIIGSTAAPGMETLGDSMHALATLEDDIHLEPNARRVLAAGLFGLGWKPTPHLAEHLAWLLERETDGLTAYSLFLAVLATHPERWMLNDWMRDVLAITPFPTLRTALLSVLLEEARLDLSSEEDRPLLALLDDANPEHRARITEYFWLTEGDTAGGIGDVVAMLRPDASMPEKVAAVRIVQFTRDERIAEHAIPALTALFRVERHPGLSLMIADVLVAKRGSTVDLDMVAFLIRVRLDDDIPAAEIALRRLFYGVEGFLLDSYGPAEQRPSGLTTALLATFSAGRTPTDGEDVATALQALSVNAAQPLAAFAATAVLAETRRPHAAGTALLLSSVQPGDDPVARALAIRVLGRQPRALLPHLDMLKALAVAPDTDPRVRRSAFYVMVNTRQSALPTRNTDVIDLFFRYLREAPYQDFADAVHGADIADAPKVFLERFTESFDAITSQAGRLAAFRLIEAPFGFGIREEFVPFWKEIVVLMLRALDEPTHDDLHYTIFWNMLHGVPMPPDAASTFASGLQASLSRHTYAERITPLAAEWLTAHRGGVD